MRNSEKQKLTETTPADERNAHEDQDLWFKEQRADNIQYFEDSRTLITGKLT